MLRTRSLEVQDAALCSGWLRTHCTVPAAFAKTLPAAIELLRADERLQGIVIERHIDGPGTWQPVAVAMSGFVRPDVFDAIMQAPRAFFLIDILDLAATDPKVLLGPDEIAAANAGKGLDLAAHLMQGGWDFADPLWRSVGTLGHEAYIKDHRGYRIRRALQEDWSRDVDIYLAAGYLRHSQFDCAGGGQRTLYYADVADVAKRAPGSTVSYIMHYAEPVCGFTTTEQRVLKRAIDGVTDQQIARQLNLSPNTVKMAWRSIYERVAAARPVVLDGCDVPDRDGVRGPEKRRRVIGFVESHPQELRRFGANFASLKRRDRLGSLCWHFSLGSANEPKCAASIDFSSGEPRHEPSAHRKSLGRTDRLVARGRARRQRRHCLDGQPDCGCCRFKRHAERDHDCGRRGACGWRDVDGGG